MNMIEFMMKTKFPERLLDLRTQKRLTQLAFADAAGIHVNQLRRYEAGTALPTFEVLRKIAVALSISADELLFDDGERGPTDDLRLRFEAVSKFPAKEKRVVLDVLDSLILKHEANKWSSATSSP
jgi:transcriptional regulator with XRE-family HTH domain